MDNLDGWDHPQNIEDSSDRCDICGVIAKCVSGESIEDMDLEDSSGKIKKVCDHCWDENQGDINCRNHIASNKEMCKRCIHNENRQTA